MVVVDNNILVYWATPSEQTAACSKLLKASPDWHAPDLWRHEYYSAMLTLKNAGIITYAQAFETYKVLANIITEHSVSIESTLKCAVKYKISAYDAQYVALAEKLNAPLYSFDKRLLTNAKPIAKKP